MLALGGVALVSMGAATARTHVRPAAHGLAKPVYSAVAPAPQPTPKAKAQRPSALAVRRLSAAHARATISLYEYSVRRSTLRSQGCDAAKRGVGGIVILDFGQPAYNGHTYGTYLFSGAFAANDKITSAMLAYAVGYGNCLPRRSKLSISLARGTSNYHPQVPSPYQAGKSWARETHELQRLVEARGLGAHVTSAAADDVEPAWDRSFHRTRDFFRGYREAEFGHVL